MRVCPKCKIDKPRDDFGVRLDGGMKTYCKPCCTVMGREHYQRNKHDETFLAKRRARLQSQRANSRKSRITFIWNTSKTNARRRNIDFTITKDELRNLFDVKLWKCARTAIDFDLSVGNGRMPFGPAIDRIDSTKGYHVGNLQVVCNVYNFAKNSFSDSDVYTMARALLKPA